MNDLYLAALRLATEIHNLEASGVEIPVPMDRAWEELTTALEAARFVYGDPIHYPEQEGKALFNAAMRGLKL